MSQIKRSYDLLLGMADYAPRADPPDRTVVICSHPRSGTTLLSEAMYFSGTLGCPLEYFSAPFRSNLERRWKSAGFPSYLAALHRHRTDAGGVFSTKLFWTDVVRLVGELAPDEFGHLRWTTTRISQSDYRRIFSLISQVMPNPEFVFVTRRDEIRQAISFFIASGTGRWRKYNRAVMDGGRPEYSFDRILSSLGVIQNCNRHWLNFFRANDLRYYPLAYEDLARNYEQTLRQLFLALGRSNATIAPPRLHKQADTLSEEFRERFMTDFPLRVRGER